MEYNPSVLTKVEDCDTILLVAQTEKAQIEIRKASYELRKTIFAQKVIEIDADLISVNAQIPALTGMIAELPPGEAKSENELELMKLEVRKKSLENSLASYGAMAVMEKDHDINRADADLTELSKYIDVVSQRKAELLSAA